MAVTAVVSGADPSTGTGAALTFEGAYAGVNAITTVTAAADGTDREPTEDFRVRFLERKASRGRHGGSVADYIAWAKEIAGVTRVWVKPQGNGPGTVLVRFVRDNDPTIFPDTSEVTAVQTYIDSVRPASCAGVLVAAPLAANIPMTLSINPDTPALRASVEAELDAMYRRRATPVGGGSILLAWLQTAVGDAPGVDSYTITSPAADTPYPDGYLIGRGTLTWI